MIKANEACCGCSACVLKCPQKCISMMASEDGFDYPYVDVAQCVGCGLCETVCPINKLKPVGNAQKVTYIGYSYHPAERKASSSGGVFSLLATEILRQGGLVFGAAFDDAWNVHHVGITDDEKLDILRRSKYVQSSTGTTYQEAKTALETGQTVLFTGTPCQIAGLKSYLGKEYPSLYTVDLICHGVPSPKLWGKYTMELVDRYDSPIQSVSFRNKETGWNDFSVCIEFKNGEIYSAKFSSDPYMQMFLSNMCLRSSCYTCAFKGERYHSDLTLGDAWGIGKTHPIKEDNQGTSVVVVNTQKGRLLLEKLEGKWNGEIIEYDFVSENIAYIESASKHPLRKKFIRALNSGDSMERMAALTKRRLIDKVAGKIKRLMGEIFH